MRKINIQVFGQNELVTHIEKNGKVYSHLISIGNPDSMIEKRVDNTIPELFKERFKENILRIEFWDVNTIEDLKPHESGKIPEMEDILKVIAFINETREMATGYTIHCWRGIARSGAIAFGIIYMFLQNEQLSSDKLVSIRRQVMPNKTILKYFDEYYNSDLQNLGKYIYKSRIKAMRIELNL